MRDQWDDEVDRLARSYNILIHQGMPAEDARGLLPHNILTKVNMVISLRALMGMAGQRLCTQAQFEHRQVWDQLLAAMRTYGHTKVYARDGQDEYGEWQDSPNSGWQFDAMANQFLPICYQTGKCQFESDFDRYCNIRDRVQANAKIGRPSSEWNREWLVRDAHISSVPHRRNQGRYPGHQSAGMAPSQCGYPAGWPVAEPGSAREHQGQEALNESADRER